MLSEEAKLWIHLTLAVLGSLVPTGILGLAGATVSKETPVKALLGHPCCSF